MAALLAQGEGEARIEHIGHTDLALLRSLHGMTQQDTL